MSGQLNNGADSSFHDRLERVAERRPKTQMTEVSVIPDWKQTADGPMAYVFALFFGMLGVTVVRLVRYHGAEQSLIGEQAEMTMALDFGAGLLASFILYGLLTRWRGIHFKFVQLAGVFGALLLTHNAVHAAPDPFSSIFSSSWTEDVLSQTVPGTMLVRGQSLPISGKKQVEAAEEPAMPRVIRMN